jgi:hypothetical protein
MAMFTRRTRIISFRVSEEEYEHLRSLCMTRHARSVSHFARAVTLGESDASGSDCEMRDALTDIHRKLAVMDLELGRLARLAEPQPSDVPRFDPLKLSRASWRTTTET